ncbi:YhdT family protein [Bacillus thuringiensis]|uniref:YhdT family protein n=1 Tax=Bacillus thuringiensis TaxID=1428 RepID=UPI0007C1B6EF|nr:YhdT family protein [Bacillus thuringiensis]AND08899.1 sodium:pantothenate symporter [Bacillus thuringiensis serovar alesti]MEC3596085.1 YhdT family protein [Bacillus thuringiensis]MED1832244.1 YhdT family protein [Bacillus thuringiensis]MED2209377.1 YhdT family protein [Bacillus thuringiensis]MED2666182.1 YhdT family protein [Bacillus thuringiensis]
MKDYHDDPRFRIAHREALIGLGLAIINFIIWYGSAYGLGSKNPSEYTYVFGFPTWFFYSCIVGFIVMVILLSLVVRFVFQDISLDEEEKSEE